MHLSKEEFSNTGGTLVRDLKELEIFRIESVFKSVYKIRVFHKRST